MAEKMLTNWFTFLLYKFLKVGGPRGAPAGVGGQGRLVGSQPRGTKGPGPRRDRPRLASVL